MYQKGAIMRVGRFAWLLSLPVLLAAQQVASFNFGVPNANAEPGGVAAGSDGAMWFVAGGVNKIGRITPAGAITEFPIPTANSGSSQIASGPDGALWFTEGGANQVGRITTAGVFTEYPIPTADSGAGIIAAGPHGSALWFVEGTANQIGRITVTGVVTEYPVPTANSGLTSIAAGPDGNMWFTEGRASKIGQITPAGVITEFPANEPGFITAGSDGALWFSSLYDIGRMTTTGVVTYYPIPGYQIAGSWITLGPDGAVWFDTIDSEIVGRITTAGAITEYDGIAATEITTGPDGAPGGGFWYTVWGYGIPPTVGEIVFVTATLTVTPSSGVYGTSLTFSGSGFAPNEQVRIYDKGVGSDALAAATADSTGAFTATASAPQSAYGYRIFIAMGQTSGLVGTAGFTMGPALIVSPSSGSVGSTAVVEGEGFLNGENLRIYWNNPRTLLGTAKASVDGSFNGSGALTFTVPAGSPAGVNGIEAKGNTRECWTCPQPQGTVLFTVE
jgi:virginiamycin B lyase